MGKTKREPEHADKQQEILAVAQRLFLESGYEASAMSRIAEQAGVAPNTIYWHYADKDALFTAVLDGLVGKAALDFQKNAQRSLEDQLLWVLAAFDDVRPLIATVHARIAVAETIRVWHDNFHRLLETVLLISLRQHGVKEADLGHATHTSMFLIEGMLAHPKPTRERRALIRWFVSALSPE